MASDEDTTPFFLVLLGNLDDKFAADQETGAIVTLEELDYEQTREYPGLVLVAFDVDRLHNNATMRIVIEDVNDNTPTFENATTQISILESTSAGSEVFVAVATDLDDTSNSQLTYSLTGSSNFRINPLSGAITVDSPLDFETQTSYNLSVRAADSGNPSRSSTMNLRVDILDQNDNPPSITNPLPMYSVRENVAAGELVGSVSATDVDSGDNAILNFTIRAGNDADRFTINSTTGRISTNSILDREEQSTYSLVVQVKKHEFSGRGIQLGSLDKRSSEG
jgi:hypothetical protein